MAAPRLTLQLDEDTTAIVRKLARPHQGAAYVKRAVIAQAERDTFGGQLAELERTVERLLEENAGLAERVQRLERKLGIP